MSDTVKIIIELPEKVFKARKIGEISPWVTVPILDAVQNGIPLNDVKAEIDKAYEDVTMYSCDDQVCTFVSKVNQILNNVCEEDTSE